MTNVEFTSSNKIPAVLPIAVHAERNQLDRQRLQILLYSLKKKEGTSMARTTIYYYT
jgi:hypothetical protein